MKKNIILGGVFVAALAMAVVYLSPSNGGFAVNVRPLESDDTNLPPHTLELVETNVSEEENEDLSAATNGPPEAIQNTAMQNFSTRQILIADSITLPLSGSAPTKDVKFSIPIEEIRQGCFRQDCIPSVDNPEFISITEATELLPEDTIGIALSHKNEERFYPFNMLVTREIVNDVVAGDPLLVTYCPLCGTGIVFERTVGGTTYEFGVSGMLWQSNLLMYNRAENSTERNLWSQVLGEAVVGEKTGTKLQIVSSDIMNFTDWASVTESGQVLNTGRIGDPYNGNYFGVAQNFGPNFDEANSPLDPSSYVYGIEVAGTFKAYPSDTLPIGATTDTISGQTITLQKSQDGKVTITDSNGINIPDVEGFWFSWVAAHPETELWNG